MEEYDIQTVDDIQDLLKALLGGTIKEMMEAEMDNHLGYSKSKRFDSDDYRNATKRNVLIAVMNAWKSKFHRLRIGKIVRWEICNVYADIREFANLLIILLVIELIFLVIMGVDAINVRKSVVKQAKKSVIAMTINIG